MIRLDRVELLNWDMQPHQVPHLARSVTLNAEKGSAIGLAWNRRAFDELWHGRSPAERTGLLAAARPVAIALEAGEARLGRVVLPPGDDQG